MKKTLIALMATFGMTGAAWASDDHRADYNRYLSSATGDATPMDYSSWLSVNGLAERSDKTRAELTETEREYMEYAESFGDGSAPSFTIWSADEPVIMKARKPLSDMEKEYVRFANSFGDATAPSFAQWKAEQRVTDTTFAENTVR